MARRARLVALPLAVLLVLGGCLAVPGSPSTPAPDAASTPDEARSATAGGATATPRSTPAGTPHPATTPRVTVTVAEVVDGDTVHVRYANGSRDTVRLLGVDTPETRGENDPGEFEGVPDTEVGRSCLREYGDAATAYAVERLADREVELGFDPEEGRRGYYGRLLAYVYVDGGQFNRDLVAEGYARMYDSSFVERPRYAAAERDARAAGRGLWACAADREGGAGGATGVVVAELHPDAEGDDARNLDDEYVVLQNAGDEPVDLSGWTVSDEVGQSYAFPDGATLAPGATLTLYTGSGTDGDGDYHWGRGRPVWNNDGDTVIVRDADGRVVVSRSY
jgi:micrococcal nuclease